MKMARLIVGTLLSSSLTIGALGACGSTAVAPAGGGDGGAGPIDRDAGPFVPLGMNDVTVLVPLPSVLSAPVLLRGSDASDDGKVLVPRPLFDRLVEVPSSMPIVPADAYDRLHLVAVRIDLCDRNLPGPCAANADGRLRLVFQPLSDGSGAEDVGFHAFYSIPANELAGAIASVRELALLQAEPTSSPLRVSPGLTSGAPEAYAAKLRALVRRHAGEAKLVRLTLNAQPIFFSAVRWSMRGLERRGATFEDMSIPGTSATSQDVTLFAPASYDPSPATDSPAGLLGAFSQTTFDDAAPAQKRLFLEALAAVDNPLMHGPDTVACVACHASTVTMRARSKSGAIDPITVAGRYTSRYDLSIAAGKSADTERTLRALGWLGKEPMISQRVANDTAQVLVEI